jgi:hypothetical protein
MENESPKTIIIDGTNNRYMINKLVDKNSYVKQKQPKKRVDSEKWTFSSDYYQCETQLKIVQDILEKNNSNNSNNSNTNNSNTNNSNTNTNTKLDDTSPSKIIIQQINKKIYGYKQQDLLKKKYDETKFLTLDSVLNKIIESQLKCRYCDQEMLVLYDISREMKQWSVDRINNDHGHNLDNFHLACLECNLKRRRRTDEKFLFTKQLNLVKTT